MSAQAGRSLAWGKVNWNLFKKTRTRKDAKWKKAKFSKNYFICTFTYKDQ